jgi:hypothetical protein
MWAIFPHADTAVPLATMGESWICQRARYLQNPSIRAGTSIQFLLKKRLQTVRKHLKIHDEKVAFGELFTLFPRKKI